MPTEVPGNQRPARPVRPDGPIISASRGHILITGCGFLPNRSVTIRITYIGDDVVDYLTYMSDDNGASVHPCRRPRSPKPGTSPSPTTYGGLLWSNSVIVSGGM